jgi:hypothetical protein
MGYKPINKLAMNELSYIYIDEKGFVTYALDKDNVTNRNYTNWKRFVMPSKNVVLFMRYYGLRFHPRTLKNVVNM